MIEKIKEAYSTSKSYPELAHKLAQTGVLSYTVDVATGIMLYRIDAGETITHQSPGTNRNIIVSFDEKKTIEAIRENQQGRSDYLGFMNAIAKAGVRFYEATLNGDRKRVTYIGIGGQYEELIPVVE